MTEHCEQPRLCDECEAGAHSYASRLTDHWYVQACTHRGTFAIYVVKGGHIIEWDLRGPGLSAERLIEAVRLALLAAQGAGVPVQTNLPRTN